jgi:hypothetical protein
MRGFLCRLHRDVPPHSGTASRWSMRVATSTILLAVWFSPFTAQAQAPTRLFWSGFEPSTTLSAPHDCWGPQAGGCWQDITGTDGSTSYTWPPSIWGGSTTHFQLLADASVNPTTVRDYMFNQILTLTGHKNPPAPTRALYAQMTQSGCCGQGEEGAPASNNLQIQPFNERIGQDDLYISYWLKFQPGLERLMGVGPFGSGPWHWRGFFGWKTAGDYRVSAQIKRDPFINNGNLHWVITGDNVANGGLPEQIFWQLTNTTVPVPVGEWFKFEAFWHRGATDGRVWMAVNGQPIADQRGNNLGTGLPNSPAPIDRIFVTTLYTSTAYPIYQWVDDLQIWSGFPPTCPDLPCAPH